MKSNNNRRPTANLRVQLRWNPEKVEELNWMREVTNISQLTDLFDNALVLLRWALEERARGREVASYDEKADKIRVLLMPVLETAARRARQQRRTAPSVSADGGVPDAGAHALRAGR